MSRLGCHPKPAARALPDIGIIPFWVAAIMPVIAAGRFRQRWQGLWLLYINGRWDRRHDNRRRRVAVTVAIVRYETIPGQKPVAWRIRRSAVIPGPIAA